MKKNIKPFIYIILTILVIIVLSIITIKQFESDHKEPELTEFGEVTYEFTGDSNNYRFNNGKVFFNENKFESIYDKKIVISDFEQVSLLEGITSEKLTIYFDNKVWKKVTRKANLNELREPITEYSFDEEILRDKENNKKKKETAFTNIRKEDFFKALKMEIEYCTIEEGCITEVFKINHREEV